MSSVDRKRKHEFDVFHGFVKASGLPVQFDSVKSEEPPLPDISCHVGDRKQYFELSELLCHDSEGEGTPSSLAHGLALSEMHSKHRAELEAAGRYDEAATVVSYGSFSYPTCESILQGLRKKSRKQYDTAGKPVSLLLYFALQSPTEPYDELFDPRNLELAQSLDGNSFSCVWLYHHASDFTWDLRGASRGPTGIVGKPLKEFASPESSRAIVARIHSSCDGLAAYYDAAYQLRMQRGS